MAAPQASPQTMAMMRKAFALLEDHFDTEAGCYLRDYSDQRIAEETGLSPAGVQKYRIDGGFGRIKPPSEFAALKAEVEELQGLYIKTEADLKLKLQDLRARMQLIEKRFE